VSINFANSSVVTVRGPDGRWFDVRVVADDGHLPWPASLFFGRGALLVGALFAFYRLPFRACYVLRRSTKKSIEVIYLGDDQSSPPTRARLVHRESRPDDDSARARATELLDRVRRGEVG
jgi:hypothetical protein